MNKKSRHYKEQHSKDRYLFYSLFAPLILLLPLIYSKSVLDVTLMPRLLTLSIILLGFTLVILVRPNKPTFFDKSVFNLAIFRVLAIYLLITIIATSQAINYKESFFDIAKTILFIVLVIFAFFTLDKTRNWPILLVKFFAIAALIALFVGFYQYFTYVFFSDKEFLPDYRPIIYAVDGLMSHKNLYASLLLLMLPFLVFGVFFLKGKWRWAVSLITALLLIMIVILETRAVWVGLAAGGGVAVTMLLLYGEQLSLSKKWRRRLAVTTVAVIVLGTGLLTQLEASGRYSALGRIQSIFNPSHADNVFRIKVWELTTKMAGDHPLLGVGPGNWKINMGYYAGGYGFKESQINWYRPHNDYLWILSEKGSPGFLTYLALFGFTLYYLISVIKKTKNTQHASLALSIMGGVVAYMAVAFFDFPYERITHQVFLGIMMAAAARLYYLNSSITYLPLKKPYLPLGVIALVAFVVVYSSSVVKFEKKIKEIRIAEARKEFRRMISLEKETSQIFKNLDPELVPIKSYLGYAYTKTNNIKKAKKAYQEALEAHPTKIKLMNDLAVLYIQEGNYEEAYELLQRALKIVPEYTNSLVNMSIYYDIKGEHQKSYNTLKKIPRINRSHDVTEHMSYLKNTYNLE